MKKFSNKYKDFAYFCYRWLRPIFDPAAFINGILNYPRFFGDLIKYRNLNGAEKMKLIDLYPRILEKTETQPFDSHYFYQDIWAFDKILKSKVNKHIDVGSRIDFVGFLSSAIPVEYVDIRALKTDLKNLKFIKGDILKLPYEDGSAKSLSCLHVAEHIGLGRYGDELNPRGTSGAARELARILAPGGNLYLSLPVGKPRLCFNAHRIHSPFQILDYFNGLKLVDFCAIDDGGRFIESADINLLSQSDYACGLFHFSK